MTRRRGCAIWLTAAVGGIVGTLDAGPLNQAFTYQGQLKHGDIPVTGVCDMAFALWDDPVSTNPVSQVGSTLTFAGVDAVGIVSGLFTVDLDFGIAAFNGQARWLEVAVRCPPGVDYTTLLPRQPVKAAPQSLFASTMPWAGLTDVPADIADGDNDTQLSEEGVEAYVTNGPLDLAFGTTIAEAPISTGPHTTDTNAAILCDGPGVFLDGAGNCVTIGAGPDGHSLDASDGAPEDVVYVDQAGRVGIGTTLPESWLVVDAPEDSGNLLSLTIEHTPIFTVDTLGHVGIGMAPQVDWTLGVEGSSNGALFLNTGYGHAGKFVNSNSFSSNAAVYAESNGESDSTHVLHATYTGEYGVNAVGVYGESTPRLGKGIGGEFRGGYVGAIGSVNADLAGDAMNLYGLSGTVVGDADGSPEKYGVAGRATGNGYTNYGVHGFASGAYGYNYAGYFESDHDSFDTEVLHVEYTGTGNTDPLGLYVKCAPADYRGIAAKFIGGNTGIHAEVAGGIDQHELDYTAIEGEAWGTTTGIMRGLHGSARGAGTNYGVQGYAGDGAKNYAGYFTSDVTEFGTHVVHAEFTGSGEGNPTAVYGKSKPGNYWGYGGYFEGGRTGAYCFVESGTDSEFLEYTGLEGTVQGLSGIKRGVSGDASGAGVNYGVYGIASGGTTNYSGYFYGVAPSSNTHVVHAEFGVPAAADAKAVYGKAAEVDYYGFGGYFVGGYVGAKGEVNPTGSSNYYGLWGTVNGGSGTNYGVFGAATGSGTNYAGYFQGDVHATGSLTSGSRSSKIDHPLDPENKYLIQTSVESPDMMNIYNGNVTTDGTGEAWVELPAYVEALNKDFRYQLTVIGQFAQAIVGEKISGHRFMVKTDKPNVEVSWQVTGVRKDPYAVAHRSPVEVQKPAGERGTYLHAEAWGKPEEMQVDTVRDLRQAQQKKGHLTQEKGDQQLEPVSATTEPETSVATEVAER